MPTIELYMAPSACSRVPLILLHRIGIPFKTRTLAFMRGDHRHPDYLALNPSGKIPLLLHDGRPLAQNTAIITWLHATFPEAGILSDAREPDAQADRLSELLRFSADLHPLVTRIRMPQLFCDLPGAPARTAEMGRASMALQLADLEAKLCKQDWLSGENWGALDAYLHWVWFRITGAGFDGTDFPALQAFYARTLELNAVKSAMADEAEAHAWLESQGLAFTPPPAS
ncbi:glutathione S-transferase family protein [Maricaulis parjimensis]|uniref:glutathione S-transferase family protein n=1 Tax=Maricaulis parjimensis TaxID=144023 RepID=UPI00193AD5D7|nr:glutathione S-transferase family protein [Maricaulis parjimensis]